MKQLSTINTVYDLRKEFSKTAGSNKLEFELEIYKKLLRFFQAGDYFYCIFNLNAIELEIVSSNIENVLGYHSATFTVDFFLKCFHPEDQVWFAKFEAETSKFLKSLSMEVMLDYKIQYDLRMRKRDGTYARMLIQVVTIDTYEDGSIQRTLALFTDITHLKELGTPVLSFINMNGGTSFINIKPGKRLMPFKEILSKREKEILSHIIAGKQNKEIAEMLFISKQTVDKHRKNMIIKTGSKNSGELIGKAIKNGWL